MASVPGFAGEFPVTGLDVGDSANRFGHDRGSWFDGIRMRLRADPHSPQLVRVDFCACQRIARRFDGHGDHVLVHAGDGFLFDGQRRLAASPDAGDLLGRDAVTRHVRAVAGKADRAGGFEEGGVLGFRGGHFFLLQICFKSRRKSSLAIKIVSSR